MTEKNHAVDISGIDALPLNIRSKIIVTQQGLLLDYDSLVNETLFDLVLVTTNDLSSSNKTL